MLDQWFSHHVIANDRRNREQIRAGALSPVDVVNECLNNIAANSELNAFARRDESRQCARGGAFLQTHEGRYRPRGPQLLPARLLHRPDAAREVQTPRS